MGTHIEIAGLTLSSVIGRGGTSTVYLATTSHDKEVAVKVLQSHWNDKDWQRFKREQEAMRILEDIEGVVPVLDSGVTESGAPYIVMPYYPGGSLNDRLNLGPVDEQAALDAAVKVGLILTDCHEANIFHRDIKPANIFLDHDNAIRVGDFGVAQIVDGRSLSTTRAYTPGYSAPEAITQGRRMADGELIDVYGFGATLWALLAGRSPFSEDAEGVDSTDPLVLLNRIANDPLGSPQAETSEWLVESIARATSKQPTDRHTNIKEFVNELETQTSTSPRSSGPATILRPRGLDNSSDVPTEAPRSSFLRPGLIAVTALIATLTIASILLLVQPWEGEKQAAPTTEPPPTSITTTTSTLAPSGPVQEQIDAVLPEGVTAEVNGTNVTLSGTVDTEQSRQAAVAAVQGIDGVGVVTDRTEVAASPPEPTTPETSLEEPTNNPTEPTTFTMFQIGDKDLCLQHVDNQAQQAKCDKSSKQQWRSDKGQIIAVSNGLCLSVGVPTVLNQNENVVVRLQECEANPTFTWNRIAENLGDQLQIQTVGIGSICIAPSEDDYRSETQGATIRTRRCSSLDFALRFSEKEVTVN